MNDPNYLVVLKQPPVQGQEHQSSGYQDSFRMHELGQSPEDHNLIQLHVDGRNTMTIRGSRTQLLLMMAIQVTHKQERAEHIYCLQGSHCC